MTKEKLKFEFHKLIDNIDDENMLEQFYEVITEFKKGKKTMNKTDIIDELTEKQRIRLLQSIEQVSDEDTIDNDKMKDEIKRWLIK